MNSEEHEKAALDALAKIPIEHKELSLDDMVHLLSYLQCGEYLFNGKDMDKFVEIKRKVKLAASGKVRYIIQDIEKKDA